MNEPDAACSRTLTGLARGGNDVDWEAIDQHLTACADCGAGLARLTDAIEAQFAGSRSLQMLNDDDLALTAHTLAGAGAGAPVIAFPAAAARAQRRRRLLLRVLAAAGAAAAAVLILSGAFVLRSGKNTPAGETTAAEFRPEFVQSISVTPERPNHTYFEGELVTISIVTLQPERIVLSVIEGHNTYKLFDTNADPGEHPLPPYRIVALRGRATLRLEAYFGPERVAREDVTLLPAEATPAP